MLMITVVEADYSSKAFFRPRILEKRQQGHICRVGMVVVQRSRLRQYDLSLLISA